MPDVQDLFAAIAALDDDFEVYSAASDPPSEAAIAAAEAALGRPLHPDHRALIARYGCAAVLVKESVWPRPVEFDVVPAWRFDFGFEIIGIAADAPPRMDVVHQARTLDAEGDPKIAYLRRTDGTVLGYDADGTLWSVDPCDGPTEHDADEMVESILDILQAMIDDRDRLRAEPTT
jgi:hypothetical protein